MMNDLGKSDRSVVPAKPLNKTVGESSPRVTETVEGRGLAKGNLLEQNTSRIQNRGLVRSALERIRLKAKGDKGLKFTNLMHNIYSEEALLMAFEAIKKNAAAGMDEVTWHDYEVNLSNNLRDLSKRLRCGGYRAKPVRRVFIPKAGGKQRPLGIPTLEDKIVQKATVEVMNAIYETDFIGFSYGYRPGRSQHNALDAVYTGILTKKVNWVLDGDIRSFFDRLDHEWLMKFIEHRIADQRVLRLIRKWLKAGVLEGGIWKSSEEGTPQGGNISPLLANIFLHYVFDLWVNAWRKNCSGRDVIVVRYADDFVVGFDSQKDAHRFRQDLEERLKKFGLELHPEKTRVIEFGPWAARNRKRRNKGKPETFNFLGFTHICDVKHGNGMFTILRKTMCERMRSKLLDLKTEMHRRMSQPVKEQGKWLRSVLLGLDRYFGVPGNWKALVRYRWEIGWRWWRALRRGNRNKISWSQMQVLIGMWFPTIQIYHPYPLVRMGVMTQGKSRMR